MTSDLLLNVIIGIVVAEFILEFTLDVLNYLQLSKPLPDSIASVYEANKLKTSVSYQKEHGHVGFVTDTITFAITLTLLLTGAFGALDAFLSAYLSNPTLHSLAFFGILYIASDVLSIPVELYTTFSIEQRYGFNKMDAKTYILDKLKGYLLTIIIGGGIISVLLLLLQWMGANFWWIFWVFISAFMVLINLFYTSLIVPLFNKLTPLPDGELKTAIMNYCHKVQFPLDNLFVIDGSKRSTKANAYFSGFGKKKKVVLYDTLIQNHTTDELVAVLAHEVGHYKHRHIIQSLILSIITVGITLYVLSLMVFNSNLSIALGAAETKIHINLIAFGILYSPISTLTGLLMSIFSRKNEYQADAYAKNTFSAAPLATALKKLSVDNLSNLNPHKAYVFFHYSHPTLAQRLAKLENA